MAKNDYTYAIARIRYHERNCLTNSFVQGLLAAQTEEEAVRMLCDKGWGESGMSAAQIVAEREKALSSFMKEILGGNEQLFVLFMENDFHNLKAAIKTALYPTESKVYLYPATVDTSVMEECAQQASFSRLPEYMQECALKALSALKETADGQMCDIIIDKALCEARISEAKKQNTGLFVKYAEHNAAVAAIKIAVRSVQTGKNEQFMQAAIGECSAFNKRALIKAATDKGAEGVYEYLSKTAYSGVVPLLKESGALFERECDNMLIKMLKPYKLEYFSIEAVAAYYLAVLNEIKTVRILLTAKANSLPEDYAAERLREMYV